MRSYTPKNYRPIPEYAKSVFKGERTEVFQWQQKLFNGELATFEVARRCDTVSVIVVVDGKIVIQEQEQPHHSTFYSIPGGRHDNDEETELEAAKRELLEETGMSCKTWKLVKAFQSSFSICYVNYVFLAIDLESQVPQKLDAGEKINNILKTYEEARELHLQGKTRSDVGGVFFTATTLKELLSMPDLYEESKE